jgi:hypothetical protein
MKKEILKLVIEKNNSYKFWKRAIELIILLSLLFGIGFLMLS